MIVRTAAGLHDRQVRAEKLRRCLQITGDSRVHVQAEHFRAGRDGDVLRETMDNFQFKPVFERVERSFLIFFLFFFSVSISYTDFFDEIVIIGAEWDTVSLVNAAKQVIRVLHYLWTTEYVQYRFHCSPVPIVGNSAAVIAFSSQICDSLERHVIEFVDVHLKSIHSSVKHNNIISDLYIYSGVHSILPWVGDKQN